MPETTKHIVKFWRGNRETFNSILTGGTLDYWTRYSVKEPSGMWTEYFGSNLLTAQPGQLLPVLDIVESVEKLPGNLKSGDRYLIGKDAAAGAPASYNIVEIRIVNGPDGTQSNSVVLPFDEKYTVRVASRDYMSYQLVNGKLITYDEVDCGTY